METVISVLADTKALSQVFLDFGEEIALLFALILIYDLLDRKVHDKEKIKKIAIGALFGIFVILGMLIPTQLAPGFIIDTRSVVISLSAVFGGPLSGIITAAMGMGFRTFLGGEGVLIGMMAMSVSCSIGIGFNYLYRRGKISLTGMNLFCMGLLNHLIVVSLFSALPTGTIWPAIILVGGPMLLLFSPITAILGLLLRDLHTRRLMAERLKENELHLSGTLQRLEEQQRVVNKHAIVAETDQAGRITYVNDKFCETSKYSREELLGQNHRMLKSGYHTDEFYDSLWSVISSGEIWQGETCNRAKDGSLYWVYSTIMPTFHAKNKKICGYISVRTDITESKRTEEALRYSQKMEAVGELTGGIAHDFNNLLGIIVGNHDLMARNVEDGSKLKKQLDKAQKAALRGATLTRRLLGFSRRSAHEVKSVNLNSLIRELEELIDRSLTAKIDLVSNLSDDLWMAKVDTSDFEDAIINLIINARDAMPEGGHLTIETNNLTLDEPYYSYRNKLEPGDYVQIIVSDTGTGMPDALKEKVFEPFFTTKEQGKGTGLGLSMVYGFVQRSNGYISVYSEENIGTAFKIYIPKSSSPEDVTLLEKPAVDSSIDGSETILIVDDEEELIHVAKHALEQHGYSVLEAANGDLAANILKENTNIDMVFSDIVMPGYMSGFELAEFSQKLDRDIKILLASGFTKDMQDSAIGKKWTSHLISKPYRTEDMIRHVRNTLDRASDLRGEIK